MAEANEFSEGVSRAIARSAKKIASIVSDGDVKSITISSDDLTFTIDEASAARIKKNANRILRSKRKGK